MRDRATDLGEHEAWYLDEVTFRLRRVPSDERDPLIAVLHDNLSERPPSASRAALCDALGPPADYAERLREARGFRTLPPRRPRSRAARAALLLMGAVVIGGAWFGWRWWTDEVDVTNSCSGAQADPGVLIEQREAAGARETIVSYVDGATASIGLCLLADERVKVADVSLSPPESSLFQPTHTRVRGQTEPVAPGDPLVPFWVDPASEDGMAIIEVVGRLGDCELFGEGTGSLFTEAQVTYEHHGRRRTTTVDLQTQYTFVSPPAAECPRPRDFDEG